MYKTHQRVDIIGKDETGGKGRDGGEERGRESRRKYVIGEE